MLNASALITISTQVSTASGATEDTMPKAGDFLVYAKGDKKGQPITPGDLAADSQPVLARPKDPGSGLVKDQTLKSLILLYRTAPANLAADVVAQSAEGIVAFSALCTHLGCQVEEWDADKQCAICPCHKGTYDLRQGGKVVSGPPPKPLAALPLKLLDQNIVVANGFSGRVGAQQQS
jgi:rieske iron-sulfur protein